MDCKDTLADGTVQTDQWTQEERDGVEPERPETPVAVKYISVYDSRPETYDGTCLRPLGLCELGGCCDTCWYRPDHPRFKKGTS